MKNAVALLSVVVLGSCLSPARYDAKFEQKFCDEWTACNPDFECDLAELDYGSCVFDRQAAKSCLTEQWTCDNSNSAVPVLLMPTICAEVYTDCLVDTGPTTTDGGVPTGTTTTTGSTSR